MQRTPRNLLLIALALVLVLALVAVGYKAFRSAQAANARADVCEAVTTTNTEVASERRAEAGASPDIAVLGDSYAQGLYLEDPLDAYPYALGDALGAEVWVDGVGGSGYVNGGPCEGQELHTRVDEVLAKNPETLIIQAGINDSTQEGLEQATSDLLATVAEDSPGTRIVVVGPFAPEGAPDITSSKQAIESATETHGAQFVDPSGWDYPVMDDGLHPTVEGHQVIAENLVPLLGG